MMKRKALTQKNTLLKNAQANAESIFFESIFFSSFRVYFFPIKQHTVAKQTTNFMQYLTGQRKFK